MSKKILLTLDVKFRELRNLEEAMEEVRKTLEKFMEKDQIKGYHFMRYNTEGIFLGIKIIFWKTDYKTKVLKELKGRLEPLSGYLRISKKKEEYLKGNIHYLLSIATSTRNNIIKAMKRKPTNKELSKFIHYVANPLGFGRAEEKQVRDTPP